MRGTQRYRSPSRAYSTTAQTLGVRLSILRDHREHPHPDWCTCDTRVDLLLGHLETLSDACAAWVRK